MPSTLLLPSLPSSSLISHASARPKIRSVSFSFPFHKAEAVSACVWVTSLPVRVRMLVLGGGEMASQGGTSVAGPTPMLLGQGMVAAVGGPYYGGRDGGPGDGNPDGSAGHGHEHYHGQGGSASASGGGRGCGYYQGDGDGRGFYQGGGDGGRGRGYYQGGRKSLHTTGELPFNTKEFKVTLPDNKPGPSGQR